MKTLKVWIADDIRTFADSMSKHSDELGIEVELFCDGFELFEVLETRNTQPDVLLVSDDLPRFPTCQTIAGIRRQLGLQALPILAICDEYNPNFRQVFARVGGDGTVDRSFNVEHLSDLFIAIREGSFKRTRASGAVDFSVKMGRISVHWHKERVYLSGILDENAALKRILPILQTTTGPIRFDVGEIHAVNLGGLQAWKEFVNRPEIAVRTIELHRCSLALVEYYTLMPGFFGDNLEIVSLELPLANEMALAIAPFAISRTSGRHESTSIGGLRDVATLSGGYRECEYNPNLQPALEVNPPDDHDTFNLRYFYFLHTFLKYLLSEIFITQQTLMDQVGRVSARYTGVRNAIETIRHGPLTNMPDRSSLVSQVRETYEPLLASVLISESLLKCLKLKLTSQGNILIHRGDMAQVLSGLDTQPYEIVTNAAKQFNVKDAETDYDNLPSPANLDKLTNAIVAMVGQTLEDLASILDGLGVHIMHTVKSFIQTHGKFISEAIEDLRGTNANDDELAAFAEHIWMNWKATGTLDELLDEAEKSVVSARQDLHRVIVTLDSHDQLRQVVEHRKDEISPLLNGVDETTIINMIGDGAVTIIEKRIVSYYFKSLADKLSNDIASDGGGLMMF